jgi:hypothetical protein
MAELFSATLPSKIFVIVSVQSEKRCESCREAPSSAQMTGVG